MVVIICIAFCGFIGLATTTGFVNNSHKQPDGDGFIALAVLLCFIAYGIFEFKSETRKVKDRLLEISDGWILSKNW